MKPEPDKKNTHPDEAQMLAYLEAPKSTEFRSLRQHLVTCVTCRQELAGLQSMLQSLRNTPVMATEASEGTHPDELILADYVEKRLSSDTHSQIKQHLSSCDNCTRMVLHYALSISEVETTAPVSEKATQPEKQSIENEAQESPGSKFRRFFSWRMPTWIGVPATALATIALFLLVFRGEKGTMKLLSYQDHQEIVFQVSKGSPGMGFLGGVRERSEAFQGMKVSLLENSDLYMKWPKIETALFYEIKIYASSDSGRNLIAQGKTSLETDLRLQLSSIIAEKRYEWTLSGQTQSGEDFITSGGFIVGLQSP